MHRAFAAASLVVIAAAALTADYPSDWALENLAVAAFVVFLWWSHARFPLSNESYGMLFAFLCLHEYGAMHSYSNTPLGEWSKAWLSTERNHYDRFVHFCSGLLLLRPWQEYYERKLIRRDAIPVILAAQSILVLGAIYEILEWLVTAAVNPELGSEFIGAQGDGFDAAKDLACALGGAAIATSIVLMARRRTSVGLS